jgi:hypothetical protein
MKDHMLTVAEAAALVGSAPENVQRLADEGQIRCEPVAGSNWCLIYHTDLDLISAQLKKRRRGH